MKGSLRLKLTLWNVAVIGVSLFIFGVALIWWNQARVADQVDRELRMRASRIAQGGPNPPFPRGPFAPEGQMRRQRRGDSGGDVAPPAQPEGERQPLGGPPPGLGDPQGQAPRDVEPLGYLRQPEIFDLSGRLVRPDPNRPPFHQPSVQLSLKGESVFVNTQVAGEDVRVFSTPLYFDGRIAGVVQVARELRDFQEAQRAQTTTLLILLPLALVAAGLGALFLTDRALKPVGDVTHAAAEISAADLSKRLNVKGGDELAVLAKTFNEMIARLESSFKQIQTAYLEVEAAYDAHRRFTADASHELRTPLTRLRLSTSNALAGPDDVRALREALEVADTAGGAMAKLVQQLLLLSRADTGNLGLQRELIDLRVVASDAVSQTTMPETVELKVDLAEESVMVEGDEDHLRRVFVNLLENAFRYAPGGLVKVSVGVSGGEAMAAVSDSGSGIEAKHLPHIFERFYRVDAARAREDGGCGLGLAICKSIVEAHGGRIWLESEPGKGTTAKFALPLSPKTPVSK